MRDRRCDLVQSYDGGYNGPVVDEEKNDQWSLPSRNIIILDDENSKISDNNMRLRSQSSIRPDDKKDKILFGTARLRLKIDKKDQTKLKRLQNYYLAEKSKIRCLCCNFHLPKCMRRFAWSVLLSYAILCSAAILHFGINLDRDEVAVVSPEVVAAASTKCKSRSFGERGLQTDLAVEATLELSASIMSANASNVAYQRYPPSVVELYSKTTTEAYRFVSSALVAWIIGVFIFPLTKNLFSAAKTMITFRTFSKNVDHICETKTFPQSDDGKLMKPDDFEFLLFLFPMFLLHGSAYRCVTDMPVPMAVQLTKKGKCCPAIPAFGCTE